MPQHLLGPATSTQFNNRPVQVDHPRGTHILCLHPTDEGLGFLANASRLQRNPIGRESDAIIEVMMKTVACSKHSVQMHVQLYCEAEKMMMIKFMAWQLLYILNYIEASSNGLYTL